MARSRRRTSRRTTYQRAAGLVALALPAPVQRVADTRLGSLVMLVGVPAMIVFGLLNVTWVDGFPTFTLNRNRAAELRNAASQQLNNFENQAAAQNWGQPAIDLLHTVQGPNHAHYAPGFPSTQPQVSSQAYDWQQQQLRQQQLYQQPNQQQAYQQQPYQQQAYPLQSRQQQQWPTNSGQQVNPYGQPTGSPSSPYNTGFALPSTSNNGQLPYTNQGGQLLRY